MTTDFADDMPTDFSAFAADDAEATARPGSRVLRPMRPSEAWDYFRSLIPMPGVDDPGRWAEDHHRVAFTMAGQVEDALLKRIHDTLARALEDGRLAQAARGVDSLLEEAGLGRDPTYSEMVFRTNLMDAYTVGATREIQAAQEDFPAWQYLGIRDGRQGADHEPHFDKYFPSSVAFGDVRGERVFNCRCAPRPVHRSEWKRLQQSGARFAKFAEEGLAADGKPPRRHAVCRVELPPDLVKRFLDFAANIPDEDLAEDGREDRPHITLKFGITDDDPEPVKAALEWQGQPVIRFGSLAVFENEEHDVLIVPVISDDLHRLNAEVSKVVPHVDSYPKYRPHVTLAYLKKGKGLYYTNPDAFEIPPPWTATEVVFSDRHRNETCIPLARDIAVPSVPQQTDYSCGAASLSAVARYFGMVSPKDPEEAEAYWRKILRTDPDQGTEPEDIVRVARETLGLEAEQREGWTLPQLERSIILGRPVVLLLQAYGDEKDMKDGHAGHYVVATGYDRDNVYFEDPAMQDGRRAFLPKAELMERWHDASGPDTVRLGVVFWRPNGQ